MIREFYLARTHGDNMEERESATPLTHHTLRAAMLRALRRVRESRGMAASGFRVYSRAEVRPAGLKSRKGSEDD